MYKKVAMMALLMFLVITGFSLVSALSFSSWLKNLFTGNVVEGENATPNRTSQVSGASGAGGNTATGSGATMNCGTYELETPRDAVASSQFNNYRAANAIDNNVDTHWFGDPSLKYPKTIDLDLGGKRCMNAVEVNVFIWDIPLKLQVQVSDDSREWRTVSDEVVLKEGAKFERIEFADTSGRYVRINEIAGKRPYGALSEIRVNAAREGAGAAPAKEETKLTVANVVAGPGLDKFYEIDGKRVFLEVDGTPVEEYFK